MFLPDDVPEGAQVNQEEWDQFLDFIARRHVAGARWVFRRLPSTPRCEACGSPFGGLGGRLMRVIGRAPSRKNPRWCAGCFEESPEGGFVGTVGIIFADVRGSTRLGEERPPAEVAELLNEFYERAGGVILRHGIVDKLIGDEVMGIYFPATTPGGRLADTLVADAIRLLTTIGYGSTDGPILDVGVGIEIGTAYVGHVGNDDVSDFTAIGDVVNTAARLQGAAGAGEVVLAEQLARQAGLSDDDGEARVLDLKGKSEPFAARVLTAASAQR